MHMNWGTRFIYKSVTAIKWEKDDVFNEWCRSNGNQHKKEP